MSPLALLTPGIERPETFLEGFKPRDVGVIEFYGFIICLINCGFSGCLKATAFYRSVAFASLADWCGENWSRRRDLNPRPTVYEIAVESPPCGTLVHGALPTPMFLLVCCLLMHQFAPCCWSKCWSAPWSRWMAFFQIGASEKRIE